MLDTDMEVMCRGAQLTVFLTLVVFMECLAIVGIHGVSWIVAWYSWNVLDRKIALLDGFTSSVSCFQMIRFGKPAVRTVFVYKSSSLSSSKALYTRYDCAIAAHSVLASFKC